MNQQVLYQETQSFSPWLLAVLLLSILLLAGILSLRLTTTVTPAEVSLRLGFLFRTRIPVSEILDAEALVYRPIRDYGGWGLRGSRGNRAWNMRGDRGVLLTRSDGRKVLIGSQKPRELLEALERAGVPTRDSLPLLVREF